MSVEPTLRLAVVALGMLFLPACSDGDSPTDEDGTGSIAGSVFNPIADQGVAGITVRAERTASSPLSTTTNLAGGFVFAGVATGGWSLTIDVPGGMQYAFGETGARTVTVERGEIANTQAFNIVEVAQQQGAIEGHVTAGGSPVPGAVLTILNAGPDEPSTTSDASGNYGFPGLAPQSYGVQITPPAGYQLPSGQPDTQVVTVEPGETTTLDWTLQATGAAAAAARTGVAPSSINGS